MRQITVDLYQFDELSEEAKQNAMQWFRRGMQHYAWVDEGIESIEAFCKHFGVDLKDYSISPYSHSYIRTNADHYHFRGVTLKQLEKDKDLSLTGYCLDEHLFSTMYENMRENGGDTLKAFNSTINAGMKFIISDMEYQDTDEFASEMIVANGYEFTEDGERV